MAKNIQPTNTQSKEFLEWWKNRNKKEVVDTTEETLKELLFKDYVAEEPKKEETEEPKPVIRRKGKWDYKAEDHIDFFDPECSYEITGYRPITKDQGLDFNPEWFNEAARTYMSTGYYTEYPKGSKYYADFWIEERKRCKEGFESHGYRITGDNYFFLNYYRMQTVSHDKTAGKGRVETFPAFHAKQYEFFHYVELAERVKKDVCALKARGLGFSEIIACMLVRPYTTTKGYIAMLTAPDKPKLDNTKNKCWLQLNWLNTNTNGGMAHVRMKINNDDRKRASKVNAQNVEYGWMSEIQTIIADTADKIRGARVDRLVFEECFGKGTKIMMADFSRKNVEDIKIGDFVLGADYTPQEVVRTCHGRSPLYIVKQEKGEDYIVNNNHKLYLYNTETGQFELMTCVEYRNKRKVSQFRGIKDDGSMCKVSISCIPIGEYFGFTLKEYGKSTDHLFVLNDGTIVHNCGSNGILTKSWIQSNALVELGGEHFGTRIAIGTAGDDMKLEGLSTMFTNPEAYNILPYKNYDTEDGIPVFTSYFIPAHKFALIPKFLDSRGVTDEEHFKEFYEAERKKLTGQDLFNYCAEHPFNPNEALLKQGDNMFDSITIADRLGQVRIQKLGVKPEKVDLVWDCPNADNNPRNKVKMIPSPNGKVLIYEQPQREPDGSPYRNLYVAGIDSIDQGTGDSATNKDVSDFCIVIKKRTFGTSMPNYVAIYKDRPRKIEEAYEIAMKLMVYYNCKAMLEHTKISIIMYFKSKKKEGLFMTRPKSTMSDLRRGNSAMIGYPAVETILRHGLELISRYVDECIYNCSIEEMLEQLLKYSWEEKRKFDIVAAMIAAELGDEDLMGFTPKVQNQIANEWSDIGWYYDSEGRKRYGRIPKKNNYGPVGKWVSRFNY